MVRYYRVVVEVEEEEEGGGRGRRRRRRRRRRRMRRRWLESCLNRQFTPNPFLHQDPFEPQIGYILCSSWGSD